MPDLIENLRKLDAEMQISLLADYLIDAKSDGKWHLAHAIQARLDELRGDEPAAAEQVAAEKRASAAADNERRERQHSDSFVARDID